jgi:DNA mismatch repair protein MutH
MERKEAIEKLSELKGQNLHGLAELYNVTVTKNGKQNKGWAGHVFERHLELPINSAQSPNFGSWELKGFPLKKLKNGKIALKETMAITMIDPVNVAQKDFENSHLLAKIQKMVCVVRLVGKNYLDPCWIVDVIDFDILNNKELYEIIKEDYDLVRNTLLVNNLDICCLSGKMGQYIQPRTKGKGHGSISRAFYARTTFLGKYIDLNLEQYQTTFS